MRVAVVSGARAPEPMGLELAELRLLDSLRAAGSNIALDIRIVGGRSARRHARRVGARWIPAAPGTSSRRAWAGADLVHLLGLDLPPPNCQPFVATVHDLAPLVYPDEGELPPWLPEIAERAAVILTPSAFTARQVRAHLGVPSERIQVFGGGPALDTSQAETLEPDELRSLGIEPPFVLRYGGYTKRKNVALLLEAWKYVECATLVLAGPAQPARDAILSRARAGDRIVVLDYIPRELLARLLRSASVLVSTSSYEGFGLPVLEALAAGTPVVAVATPFVEEVCGDAALVVENRPDEIAGALQRVLDDHELAAHLRRAGVARAAGFTWPNAANTVLRAYARANTSR